MENKLYAHIITLIDNLNNNNYRLVHVSNTKCDKINHPKIFIESYLLYEIARKYTPINIEESIEIESYLDIDPLVKKYMLKYGIDNVRGGTYCEFVLPENTYNTLKKELYEIEMNTISNIKILDNMLSNYEEDILLNKEDILVKKDFYMIKQREYEMLLFNYNKIKYIENGNEKIELTQDFIKEIDFLRSHVDEFFSLIYNSENVIDKYTSSLYVTNFINKNNKRYQYITVTLKKLYLNFIETRKQQNPEMENDKDYDILNKYLDITNIFIIKNPGFQFDRFFQYGYFHSLYTKLNDIYNTNEKMIEILKKETYNVLNIFEYMYYVIINKLTEYEFDLLTYNTNDSNFNINILYYTYLLSLTPNNEI